MDNEPRPTTIYKGQNIDQYQRDDVTACYAQLPALSFGACFGGCGGTYSANRYAGVCDPDGCDFNSYRMGVKDFYGKGKRVDTSKKFTVVTQSIGTGADMEIKRFYVQGGKTIAQPASAIPGVDGNSITTKFYDQQKAFFDDTYTFKDKGGMANMAKALANGMVLVMSLWDDHYSNMLWLDSTYPTEKTPDTDLETGRGE